MSFEQNNSEVCFSKKVDVTSSARLGAPSTEDIARIADVLEGLAGWWRAAPKD
jgi:hypothetical protein